MAGIGREGTTGEAGAAPARFTVPEGLQATPAVLELYGRIGPAYRWMVVVTTMLGAFSTLLTSTIVNVAIPDIMGALGITLDQAQWLSTAFLASGTVTMLLTAWSMRAFGVRATYLFGMSIFLFGSVLGGLAPNSDVLFIARVIQGAASGLLTPISTVLISQVFPLSQRGRAMGLMSVGTVLAPALGPTLGGYLVEHLSWHWVFFMAVPFAIVTMPMAQACLPEREERGPRPEFDWTGVVLCASYLSAFLIGFTEAQRAGFHDDFVTLTLVFALCTFIGWIVWELHTPSPMLELRLFLIPRFVAASIVTFAVGLGLYGSTYVLPLFLQTIVGMTPTASGLLLAPAGLVMAALFPVAGWLADISSARRMIIIGMVIFGISSYPMIWADANMPIIDMMFWYAVGRVGLAMLFPCLNAASLKPLTLQLLAQGSGATNFLRQLGGAVGVVLISYVMQERIAFHTDNFDSLVTWGNKPGFELIRLLQEDYFRLGLTGYNAFENAYMTLFQAVHREALVMGYRDSFMVVLVVFIVTLVPAWFIDSSPGRGQATPQRPAG
jgi:EmrB/QacA subfamily drug resistance transporter